MLCVSVALDRSPDSRCDATQFTVRCVDCRRGTTMSSGSFCDRGSAYNGVVAKHTEKREGGGTLQGGAPKFRPPPPYFPLPPKLFIHPTDAMSSSSGHATTSNPYCGCRSCIRLAVRSCRRRQRRARRPNRRRTLAAPDASRPTSCCRSDTDDAGWRTLPAGSAVPCAYTKLCCDEPCLP